MIIKFKLGDGEVNKQKIADVFANIEDNEIELFNDGETHFFEPWEHGGIFGEVIGLDREEFMNGGYDEKESFGLGWRSRGGIIAFGTDRDGEDYEGLATDWDGLTGKWEVRGVFGSDLKWKTT